VAQPDLWDDAGESSYRVNEITDDLCVLGFGQKYRFTAIFGGDRWQKDLFTASD
jgi:hypothetical protein